MIAEITREKTEKTKDLADAIKRFFGLDLEGRLCIFTRESMDGEVAKAYNQLGLESRNGTYKKIAGDFKVLTDYKQKSGEKPIIFDIGCGSGLLTLELAEQTGAMVYGVDKSKDMIKLADENTNKRIMEHEERKRNFPRPLFLEGDVSHLSYLNNNKRVADYVVCRNALHRFRNPKIALKQMLSILKPKGQMYIRDLKRDADWKTVIKRIGDQRWSNPELVKDYLGAMAQMLTTSELSKILIELGTKKFTVFDGRYRNGNEDYKDNLKEFEEQTEYVCIIKK